jgi:glycosyltransferase involved in cell wall biosynthesis
MIKKVSVVVPAYNEEGAVGEQLSEIQDVMKESGWEYEIIVINDGSTDKTLNEIKNYDVRIINFPKNRGYGASLKAGIKEAKYPYVCITDADGTYPSKSIPNLLAEIHNYDMVVGARISEKAQIPISRKPAKWFLRKLASYLAGQNIPDLNSGLRVMRKEIVQKYYHILPPGFSFTTTITLSMLCNDYQVCYQTIDYYQRKGTSKIRPTDAYHFLLLVLRTIVFFNPLKVFLPIGGLFFLLGLSKFIYDIFIGTLSETAIMGFLGAFIFWAIGLLSDQIARVGLGNGA